MHKSTLPQHLRRVALQQQAGVRIDDVDFAKHNRTRFVGLENDIANCYANPLLQVPLQCSCSCIPAAPTGRTY